MLSPFHVGLSARQTGVAFVRNPYAEGSAFAAAWERGWLARDALYGPYALGRPAPIVPVPRDADAAY